MWNVNTIQSRSRALVCHNKRQEDNQGTSTAASVSKCFEAIPNSVKLMIITDRHLHSLVSLSTIPTGIYRAIESKPGPRGIS